MRLCRKGHQEVLKDVLCTVQHPSRYAASQKALHDAFNKKWTLHSKLRGTYELHNANFASTMRDRQFNRIENQYTGSKEEQAGDY